MRGRKPKPSAIKETLGNPGKRAKNRREPKPPAGAVEVPRELTGVGRLEWARLVPIVKAMGVFSAADRMALIAVCQTYENWQKYERHCKRPGKTDLQTLKWYRRAALAEKNQLRQLLSEFGLTPSSRSRIQTPEPPPPDGPQPDADGRDGDDKFLEGNGDEVHPN